MKTKGGVPSPNPILDGLLVGLFLIEVVVVLNILRKEHDMLLLFFAMLGIMAIMIHVVKIFFRIWGGWISRLFAKQFGNPLRKKTTMKKWCDQAWQLAIHTSMALLEISIISKQPWAEDTTTMWNSNSTTAVFPSHSYEIRAFYVIQLAIWVYTAFSCKFLEEVRKDYLIMMTHHVVTIGLVGWSYAIGFLPIGVMILFLHDVTDIPLDILKMLNYLKIEGMKGLFITEIWFVGLVVEWFYLRVYLFPSKLIYSAAVECREACLPLEIAHDYTNLFPTNPGPPSHFFFIVLLIVLWLLHIWWGCLIVRVALGVISGGAHQAGRDEYEGTSSDSDNEKED